MTIYGRWSSALNICFSTFPRTQLPATFILEVVAVFERHANEIDTEQLKKGLTSDEALAVLRADLVELGFDVEASKRAKDKIKRPVFFGRLAATPHPLFLQRTLVSRKRAKIGARAGPIWHYVALRGTRRPLHVRVHARSKDLWDRHVVPSSPAPARRLRTTSGSASYRGRQRTVKTSRIGR